MNIDRKADLHYAYQFGEDAARNDYPLIKAEFLRKFAGDDEALAEFEKGYHAQLEKMARTSQLVDRSLKS